jgi:predicted anti-sigma-YlaC factor YlaD
MDCTFYREAISARIDGELGALPSAALDRHLTGCRACRSWAEAATQVTRAARVAPAEVVPDLTDSILAAVAAGSGHKAANRKANRTVAPRQAADRKRPAQTAPGSPVGIARFGLLMVGLAQLCLAVPALLGDDGGAPIHVAHEQGSWFLALAVGLLVVAWRPWRAAAMLPLVAALVVGLGSTMALDIWAGRTQAAAEAPHGLAFLGLGFLWVVAYPTAALGRRRGGRPRPA